MYKFIHFSDTHLGRKHPSEISKERVESSIKALEFCVNKAVEEQVDFVLHSGDFFDTVYPWHTVIDAAKDKLKPLIEENIPMYVIRGNHDRSYGQGRKLKGIALEHMDFDNIHIIDPSPHDFPEKGYLDFNDDIRVYGLGYHASRTPEILSEAVFECDKFNILLMHDFVKGVTQSFSENVVPADVIGQKDLQYVGIGHDHEANPVTWIDDVLFAVPGGTIDYDFNTTDFGKKYNLVEIEDGEVVDVETGSVPQSLELVKIDFDIDEFSEDNVLEELESVFEEGKSYAVKLRLFGELENSRTDLPISEVVDTVEEEFDCVLSCGIIDNTVLEGMKSYDSEEGDDGFDIESYLRNHLGEESSEGLVRLHEFGDGLLGNEENLTSSGFNLNKQGREKLEEKVEKELFEE